MSISELGSLGEFVGSIAVLATLIYLAYQTRQNGRMLTQSMEAQTASVTQANVDTWDGVFRSILENQDVAQLYRRIKAGERVSDEEYEQLEALLTMFALRLENLMIQYRLQPVTLDNLDQTLENIFDHWVRLLMTSPSSQVWWRRSRRSFTLEFTNRIDDQIRKSLSPEGATT